MEVTVQHLGAVQFEIKSASAHHRERSAAGEFRARRGHDPARALTGVTWLMRGFLRCVVSSQAQVRLGRNACARYGR